MQGRWSFQRRNATQLGMAPDQHSSGERREPMQLPAFDMVDQLTSQ